MDASKILRTYLNDKPEQPVPYAGDIVNLDYPPKQGTVAVHVETRSNFIATFTITVPADELSLAIDEAKAAIVRSMGNNADAPASVEAAREKLGDAVFDARVGNTVRLAFLSAAMMRTGIFAFLSPEILPSGPFVEGEDYTFQARMTLRPRSKLTDTKAPAVKKPPVTEVTDAGVDERMNQMIGGSIPWDQVSPEKSESLQNLRGQVREILKNETESVRHDAILNACVDVLVGRLTIPAPNKHVEMLRDSMANNYATELVAQGVDWDAYSTSPAFDMADFKRSMTENAIVSLNRGMALDALADALHLDVTVDDILGAAGQVAPGHEAEAIEGMLRSGQLPQLCEVTRRIKAGDWLVRNSKDA